MSDLSRPEGAGSTPIKIAQRAVRWKESEIEEWVATRPRVVVGVARRHIRESLR